MCISLEPETVEIPARSDPLQHVTRKSVEQKNETSDAKIKDGDFVSYKKLNTLEVKDTVIQSDNYPLHQKLLGKEVGDVVMLLGIKYEIISII